MPFLRCTEEREEVVRVAETVAGYVECLSETRTASLYFVSLNKPFDQMHMYGNLITA